MKRIPLEIKAISPLSIGRQKPGGSVSEAVDYIPGSVIRGAIAAKILEQSDNSSGDLSQPEAGGDFQSLFLGNNPAIFHNAYPSTLEGTKGTRIASEIIVLPATAVSSKTNPGFTSKNKNGVFDTLIDRFCAEACGFPYDPDCPNDGGRVEPFSGFYSYHSGGKQKYYSHTTNKRLLTRVGINRRRATAEEQILYSIEVLNESQATKNKPIVYSSSILVEDVSLTENLKQFIDRNREGFRFGGSISRGLGKVEITAKLPIDEQPDVETRINNFNSKLKERWKQWQEIFNPERDIPSENRTYFTLDLQSDAILTEQWRRTTVISKQMLKEFTTIENSSLNLEVAYSSYDYLSGWNSAWGLMKDIELITNKGAVYLFSIDTNQLDSWVKALIALEMRGVGDRTSEGFGQVRVCNEFHLALREEAK
jgi:CRISPR-associated protein Csx10